MSFDDGKIDEHHEVVRLRPEIAELLEEAKAEHLRWLQEEHKRVSAMTLDEFLARGICLTSTTDMIAGRLAKAGWREISYDHSNPSWMVSYGSGEMRGDPKEIAAVLAGGPKR